MPVALIYRNDLLRLSETFIHAQGNALRSFTPQFIGLSPVTNGLPVDSPILLTKKESSAARISKALYQISGFGPSFHSRARQSGAELIHAHFFPDGIAAMALSESLEIPLIVTLHGYDVTRRQDLSKGTLADRLQIKCGRKLWDTASLFICVSEFIRQQAIESGFPPNKLRVHYTGSDLQYFCPSTLIRKPELVLFVGRLVEKKGCRYLIKAMAEVQRKHPRAELVIIGDGPERPGLETLSRELEVNARFLGPQPRNVIRDWLMMARIFCGPSITASDGDSEGLGMVFSEAQATGLPVVSFSHGGIPEVVRHGETGLLAPERDDKLLAEFLLQLIEDDSFWSDCSERGVEWTAQRFDLRIQTRELEGIYREVVSPT